MSKKTSAAAERKTEYEVLGTSNIFEELRDRQPDRLTYLQGQIERHRQIQRIQDAKLRYLEKIQASHGQHYRENDKSHVFKVIGESQCAIGDMPGWELSPDTWLHSETSRNPDVRFAIGADGILYAIRKISERDSFFSVEDMLMGYPVEQLEQIADAIEAYIAECAKSILALMQKRFERAQAISNRS